MKRGKKNKQKLTLRRPDAKQVTALAFFRRPLLGFVGGVIYGMTGRMLRDVCK